MSAILSADDLNDFISPGLACIKPIKPVTGVELSDLNENGEVEIQLDDKGQPLEISKIDGKIQQLSPAQINLSDCLACAGCITSAEEILVAQHSHEELIKALSKRDKQFVVSVSHQSRASLATAFDISVEKVDKLLINLFINQMGFKYIIGTSLGRKLSLIKGSQEIVDQKEQADKQGPILSSICPGWVLYAEKTHPYILPRLSTVKSPQQITGCLLKNLASDELKIDKSDIYHLSIMPCFDKKLESARPEADESGDIDVDCVLTAKELITLLNQYDEYQFITPIDEDLLPDYKLVAPKNLPFIDLAWSNDSGSTSGGYGLNYLKFYQEYLIEHKKYDSNLFKIEIELGKNLDIYELILKYNDEPIANTAIINGFKNIQNLVRKLKPGNTKLIKANPLAARRRARKGDTTSSNTIDATKADYVEIMACPNGCINGGGQITHGENDEKAWLKKVINNYESIPTIDLFNDKDTLQQVNLWVAEFCQRYHISSPRLFHTWFKEVEKETDPNAIMVGAKW